MLDDAFTESSATRARSNRDRQARLAKLQPSNASGRAAGPQEDSVGNSLKDLLNTFKSQGSSSKSGRGSVLDSLDPLGSAARPPPQRLDPAPMRLNPSLGKTVMVDANRGRDVGRAFRMLDSLVGRNQIKTELLRQRYHERPGLKRKRLKMARWRRRFKDGFVAMVNRVHEMKKMGW